MSGWTDGNGSIFWSHNSKVDGKGPYSHQLKRKLTLLVDLPEESKKIQHESVLASSLSSFTKSEK